MKHAITLISIESYFLFICVFWRLLILKHTFVTQASRHGVSAENIVYQTGTELRTLEKFYRARDEASLRHEMQGTEYNTTPFHKWVRKLSTQFKERR